jgi:hypothetical protein
MGSSDFERLLTHRPRSARCERQVQSEGDSVIVEQWRRTIASVVVERQPLTVPA